VSSRHLIDPELLSGLEMLPTFEFSAQTLPMVRQGMTEMLRPDAPADDPAIRQDQREVEGDDGHQIALMLYQPTSGTAALRPAILHIHGGGFIIGSAEMSSAVNADMAKEMGAVVVSVDYRLAPESPHPGPVEDCYAALKWLHENSAALGIDRDRIAVTGESAGGGLAAALALLARDRGEYSICHQHLIYPMIDDRTCVRNDPHPYTGEFVWQAVSNHFGWASLLGQEPGSEGISPYAAASRATDLSGLPTTFIAVGALDLFLDEDMDYALRLTRAGVPTELHIYPGAYHGFDMSADADVVIQAKTISHRALKRALYRP
jgi:acetyl esterase/lipase